MLRGRRGGIGEAIIYVYCGTWRRRISILTNLRHEQLVFKPATTWSNFGKTGGGATHRLRESGPASSMRLLKLRRNGGGRISTRSFVNFASEIGRYESSPYNENMTSSSSAQATQAVKRLSPVPDLAQRR